MYLNIFVIQAKEELSSWGVQLDHRLIQLQGRKLNPEKVLFRKNIIVASEEANWSREAVHENVMSAVSLLGEINAFLL